MNYRYHVKVLGAVGLTDITIEADDIQFHGGSVVFVEDCGSHWEKLQVYPASRTAIVNIEYLK